MPMRTNKFVIGAGRYYMGMVPHLRPTFEDFLSQYGEIWDTVPAEEKAALAATAAAMRAAGHSRFTTEQWLEMLEISSHY